MTAEHADAARQILKRGRTDPAWFIETVFGSKLWEGQKQIASDVFANPRVIVKAGHSVGKTYTAARICLAWFYLYPGNSRIITTAPTWSQVSKLLWTEIATVFAHLPRIWGGVLVGTELRGVPGHLAVGLSTDQPERFQGHHAEHLLVILDEAPGVRADIWEAAHSLGAGGHTSMLCIGNPTTPGGPFFDAFTSGRALWKCHTISAFDSPNLAGLTLDDLRAMTVEELDTSPWPGLTSRRWVLERAEDWGEGSPLWCSRVLGEFPVQGDDSLIALSWIDRATRVGAVEPTPDDDNDWQVGIDVAGPGSDETVVIVRHGRRVVGLKSWAGKDARGDVLAFLEPWKSLKPPVAVDSVGIGYYLARHLMDQGWNVAEVNVGARSADPQRFSNLKAELHWQLREVFESGQIEIPDDPKLVSQLSTIRYRYNSLGRVEMISKAEQARTRGLSSPDRAEALMLAFACSSRVHLGGRNLRQEILI